MSIGLVGNLSVMHLTSSINLSLVTSSRDLYIYFIEGINVYI